MAQYASPLNMLANFESFSGEDRFSYSKEHGFRVAIPRMNDWDLHQRASISELKAHLLPNVKLTRCGHISYHQPARPTEQDYSWWLAQLIHFGLNLQFSKEQAKIALRHALVTAQIRVPDRLLQLERGMRRSCDQREREAISKVTAARTLAAIHSSQFPVAIPLQRENESRNTSCDNSHDSSGDDYYDPHSEAVSESAVLKATVESFGKEDEEPEFERKIEPLSPAASICTISEAASSAKSSSNESSTYSRIKIRSLFPPKFNLPKPMARPYTRPIKTEPVEQPEIRHADPFAEVVQEDGRRVMSQPASVGDLRAKLSRSIEERERSESKNKQMLSRDEYLKMREKLAGSSSSTPTRKRLHHAIDESEILDQAQDFLNSPSKWRDEHNLQPMPSIPFDTKRLKSPSSVRARQVPRSLFRRTRSKRHVEMSPLSARSKTIVSHIPSSKRLKGPGKIADGVVRPVRISSSRERYVKEETTATGMDFNRKRPFEFPDIKAYTSRPERNDVASSGPNPINVSVVPDASSPPPTPTDRALDRMLAAESRLGERRAKKPGKQRLIRLSRKN